MIQATTHEWEIAKTFLDTVEGLDGPVTLTWTDFEAKARRARPFVAVKVESTLPINEMVDKANAEILRHLRGKLLGCILVIFFREESDLMVEDLSKLPDCFARLCADDFETAWGLQQTDKITTPRSITVFAFEEQTSEETMNVKVPYEEVAAYIARHYGIRPRLSRLDDATLHLSLPLGSHVPPLELQLRIEAQRNDVVCMSYVCSEAVAQLIAGTVGHLGDRLPAGLKVLPAEKRVNFFPEYFNRLREVMAHARLASIRLQPDGLEFLISLS